MFCKKYKEQIDKYRIINQVVRSVNKKLKEKLNEYHRLNDNLKKSNRDKNKTISNLKKSIKKHIKLEKLKDKNA